MEPVLPNTPMRGWSILTTIENFVQQERPQCGGTLRPSNAGCLGQEGDPCSVKVPNQHLFPVIRCGAESVPSGCNVRFSNRPFGVKHFQTIHHCNVDVAHGLVLLFGIGTMALPAWDSKTRRNNLLGGLAVEERQVQADIRTHLIHRPARDIFPPLGGARVFSYRV